MFLVHQVEEEIITEATNYDLHNMITPVNVEELHKLLRKSSYDVEKTRFLINGFTEGFDLGYQGPLVRQSRSQNIPFTVGDDKDLWGKLIKEIKLKRVAGLYRQIPFENYMQSPIGLVPKDNGTKTRLIFHLSYEFKDEMGSLNGNTLEHLCSVKYNDFDHAVNNCLQLIERFKKENPGQTTPVIYFGKTYIQSAFRILGLKRSCWNWLVMMARNPQTGEIFYFVDKCLPFGVSKSCALFQEFSDALNFLFEYLVKLKKQSTNYLDDFLFLALSRIICDFLIGTFLDLCKSLNVPISMEKTQWSSPVMVFLGILLNGKMLMLGIPLEKKQKALQMINLFIDKKKATVLEVQSLCGYLNFLNKAIFPGRAFTQRMYSKYAEVINKVSKVKSKLKNHHHV